MAHGGQRRRAVLDVGRDGGDGLRVRPGTRAVAGHGAVSHHGLVRGLEPGTRSRISHRGGRALTGTSRPAPLPGQGSRSAAFGDRGVTAEASLPAVDTAGRVVDRATLEGARRG